MNPAKRRRIDATSSTLRKPFRSPLKVPIRDLPPSTSHGANDHEQQILRPHQAPRSISDISKRCLTQSFPQKSSTSTNTRADSIDDVTTLQKRYSALTQQLRKLQQDLDVAEQARKLHTSDQSDQLDQTLLKWRDIARSAADEIFEITNNRIRDAGGLQIWYKNIQERSQDGWTNNMENKYSEGGEQDARDDENIHEQQEQPFTMNTMLRQFNIDPNLLGFDDQNEQWSE